MREIAAIAVLCFLTGTGWAATLGKTPVDDAMRAEVASATWSVSRSVAAWSDDFGVTPEEKVQGKKSVFKAALFSALIPGGGQYYLGNRRTARYFFTAEALTWIGYLSFQVYGDWRKDDYIRYAAIHANAQLEGKSDDFLSWVGFYNSIREFNSLGRAWDNSRPYLEDTPENHWNWLSEEERQTFRDLRNRSREAYRRSDFMIGVAVVDRVISIIDAVRSAGRINRRIGIGDLSSSAGSIAFSVDPLSPRRQVCLTLYPGF